jgi:hypothetical protein
MNRAGAALRHAAAVFGAGHAQIFAQRPQQRRVAIDIQLFCLSIHGQGNHRRLSCGGVSANYADFPPCCQSRAMEYSPQAPPQEIFCPILPFGLAF